MTLALFSRQLARRGKTITIYNRSIVPPAGGSADFSESFSGAANVQAIIDTQRGKTLFDGVSVDQPITHKFCLLYLAGVTAESWIVYNGQRYKILDVENCEEADEILILRCAVRGASTLEAASL